MDALTFLSMSLLDQKDDGSATDILRKYSKYGVIEGTQTLQSIYNPNDTLNLASINASGSEFLHSLFYAICYSSDKGRVQVLVREATPDEQNSMNLLGINSSLLTSLFPWNKADYVRYLNQPDKAVLARPWLPTNTCELKTDGLTVIKLIALYYLSKFIYGKYKGRNSY